MPSNIEIKARTADLGKIQTIAEELSDAPCEILSQEDIFFHSQSGRLKLRIFSEDCGESIFYDRPDSNDAKQSNYQIYKTTEPLQLKEVLSSSLGESSAVRKRRRVYLVGQTRIHLDEVEGLGTFVELEVVLHPNQDAEEGHRIAGDLMDKLGIKQADLISCAYADLLKKKAEQGAALDADPAALHPRE